MAGQVGRPRKNPIVQPRAGVEVDKRGAGAKAQRGRRKKDIADGVRRASKDDIRKAVAWANSQAKALEANITSPRDLYLGKYDAWEAPEEVRGKIVVLWICDKLLMNHPHLFQIWSPITPEVQEALCMTFNSTQRTPEGVPMYGTDMIAHWAHRRHYEEQIQVEKDAGMGSQKVAEIKELEEVFASGIDDSGSIGSEQEGSSETIPHPDALNAVAGSTEVQEQRNVLGTPLQVPE